MWGDPAELPEELRKWVGQRGKEGGWTSQGIEKAALRKGEDKAINYKPPTLMVSDKLVISIQCEL